MRESTFIDHTSRYRDLADKICEDPRFIKLDSERERADLFDYYVNELDKKEKDRLKTARQENLTNFKALLAETEITSKSRWSEVKVLIKEDERYLALDGDDKYRLQAFDDYM